MKVIKNIIQVMLIIICTAFMVTGIYFIPKMIAERADEVRWEMRGHGNAYPEVKEFKESAKQLKNHERGFYYMHGFRIDDSDADFRENISNRFCKDSETKLAMIQINLQYYNNGPISEKGLSNLRALFDTLRSVDKKYIVRFLYDWNGENEQYEPKNIDIILEHMKQVAPVINENKDRIYVLQGLFIGNWGEMNGTKYTSDEDIQVLASTLSEVTDEDIYMSVRMPMFYRKATLVADPKMIVRDNTIVSRLGLYNDGMLGSWSDYGTYGNHKKDVDGLFTYWNREEELEFQEILCQYVPNGGEVMNDNEYNDFDNAVTDLKRMHVTYLNKDFDKKVLDKWAAATVEEEGIYNGMDGLTYMERHLGYRLLINKAELSYKFDEDMLSIKVNVSNVGFAPLYHAKDIVINMVYDDGTIVESYKLSQDIRELVGGNNSSDEMKLEKSISLHGKSEGTVKVYFDIKDPESGERIELANENESENYGYYIGNVKLESVEDYKNQ